MTVLAGMIWPVERAKGLRTLRWKFAVREEDVSCGDELRGWVGGRGRRGLTELERVEAEGLFHEGVELQHLL